MNNLRSINSAIGIITFSKTSMIRPNAPACVASRRVRRCAVLLTAVFAALPVFQAAAQTPELATLPVFVSHTPADADGAARVEVRVPDYRASLGITAYQFVLPLPAGVEFVGTSVAGTHSAGGFLGANVDGDGRLRIAFAGTTPSTAVDAPLLHIDLKIASGQGGELYPKDLVFDTTANRGVRPGSVFPAAVPFAAGTAFTRFPESAELEILAPDLALYEVRSFEMAVRFESTRLRLDSVITRQTQAGAAAMQVAYRVTGDTLRIAAAASSSLSGDLPLLRLRFTPRVNPLGRAELPVSILSLSFNNTGGDLPGADPSRLIPGRVVLDGDSVGVQAPDASLLFSEYVSGTGSDAALEVFNASGTPAILRQDGFPGWMVLWLAQPGGTGDWADSAEVAVISFPEGFRLAPYGTFVIAHPDADPAIVGTASGLSNHLASGGGAAIALAFDADGDGAYDPAVDALVDVIGDLSGVPGSEVFANTTLVRHGSVAVGAAVFNADEWTAHAGAPVRYLGENGYYASIDGPAGYRLLSLPMTGGSASQVADDTPVQGIADGPYPGEAPNFLLYGAERRLLPPASITAPLSGGQGFALYFFNNNLAGSQPLPLTLQAAGPEPVDNVDFPLNTTEAAGASGGGAGASYFTLAGNPFASGYDLSAITHLDGDGIQNHVHVWSAELGTYQLLDRTAGRVVAPWQGFWVEVSADGAPTTQIRFPLQGRASSAGADRFLARRAQGDASLSFTIRSPETLDQAIRLDLRPDAEHGFDRADASKLTPWNSAYAVLAFRDADGRFKSVESRPSALEEALELDLSLISAGADGPFTLSWDGVDSFPADWGLSLLDRRTGEVVDLREHATMAIDVPESPARSDVRSGSDPVLSPALELSPAGAASSDDATGRRFALTLDPHAGASGTSARPDSGLDGLPREYALHAAYPNPFNPATQIRFDLPVAGYLTLDVFDLLGRKVATLHEGTLPAGRHRAEWEASGLSSGVYLYRLNVQGGSFTRSLTLLR